MWEILKYVMISITQRGVCSHIPHTLEKYVMISRCYITQISHIFVEKRRCAPRASLRDLCKLVASEFFLYLMISDTYNFVQSFTFHTFPHFSTNSHKNFPSHFNVLAFSPIKSKTYKRKSHLASCTRPCVLAILLHLPLASHFSFYENFVEFHQLFR